MTMENLISEAVAAQMLGVRHGTLRQWRHEGVGPAYIQLGRRVLYDPADIAAYVAKHRHGG